MREGTPRVLVFGARYGSSHHMKQKIKKLTVGTPKRCISPATHQILAFDGLHSALQKLACEARCNGIGNWCNMRLRVIEISRALASHELVNGQSVHSNGAFPENFPRSISPAGSDLSEWLIGLTKLYYVPLYAIRDSGVRPSL